MLLYIRALLIHRLLTEHMVTAPKHAIYNMLLSLYYCLILHSNVSLGIYVVLEKLFALWYLLAIWPGCTLDIQIMYAAEFAEFVNLHFKILVISGNTLRCNCPQLPSTK